MHGGLTDDEILDALRRAADAAACDAPLSTGVYERHRAVSGGPSVAWVVRRFGSWREACLAAGLPARAPSARRATWSEGDLLDHVRAYLDGTADGVRASFAGYAAWAKEHPGAPSGATVRARMSWSEAVDRARH